MTTDNSQIPDGEDESQETPMNSDEPRMSFAEIKKLLGQQALEALSRDKRDDYQEFFIEDCSDCSQDSLSSINKWEAANGTPNKLYFSLSEAVSITNLDQIALLHAGGKGSIVLCTPLPPGASVAPFYEGAIGHPIEQPELLALSDADCRSIELNGFVAQSDFERGYAFMFSESTCIYPGYRNYDYMYKEATWKIFADNYPSYINVLSNQLFITRAGLCQFLDSQAAGIKEENSLSEVQSPSSTEPWLIKDDGDPDPIQIWYTPARYFARQLIENDPKLLNNRQLLSKKVADVLAEKRIFKRGGKKPLTAGTVLKAFSNVKF